MALESLHALQVAYRDLKMENILMTNDGHLILTDLGMSRILHPGQRSFSYVGTPEYMVPTSRRGCCVGARNREPSRPRPLLRLLVARRAGVSNHGGRGSLHRKHCRGGDARELPNRPCSTASRTSRSFSRPSCRTLRGPSSARCSSETPSSDWATGAFRRSSSTGFLRESIGAQSKTTQTRFR